MKEYESMALDFYNNNKVLRAISENASLSPDQTASKKQLYQDNTFLIEDTDYIPFVRTKSISENIQL